MLDRLKSLFKISNEEYTFYLKQAFMPVVFMIFVFALAGGVTDVIGYILVVSTLNIPFYPFAMTIYRNLLGAFFGKFASKERAGYMQMSETMFPNLFFSLFALPVFLIGLTYLFIKK